MGSGGGVVMEGFLEEGTSDLHFRRWRAVRWVEREEEQNEQKSEQEITQCFSGTDSHPCGLRDSEKARLARRT